MHSSAGKKTSGVSRCQRGKLNREPETQVEGRSCSCPVGLTRFTLKLGCSRPKEDTRRGLGAHKAESGYWSNLQIQTFQKSVRTGKGGGLAKNLTQKACLSLLWALMGKDLPQWFMSPGQHPVWVRIWNFPYSCPSFKTNQSIQKFSLSLKQMTEANKIHFGGRHPQPTFVRLLTYKPNMTS